MLFNKTRQNNIQIFYKIIFFFSSIGQDNSKLQKHKLFILIEQQFNKNGHVSVRYMVNKNFQ